MTLSNSMSITPSSPLGQGGRVRTWVSSRWKNPWRPGQFSVEINTQTHQAKPRSRTDLASAGRGPQHPFRRQCQRAGRETNRKMRVTAEHDAATVGGYGPACQRMKGVVDPFF